MTDWSGVATEAVTGTTAIASGAIGYLVALLRTSPKRIDAGGKLGRFPLIRMEMVHIEVTATLDRKQKRRILAASELSAWHENIRINLLVRGA